MRGFLGKIDLDPASSAKANETVKAGRYFTIEENGLDKVWRGQVWLNPPFSRGNIQRFVEKLVFEYQSGNITEAIMLTNNATETVWFQHGLSAASAVCLVRSRIKFISPRGDAPASPILGQTLFYFGSRPVEFAVAFADIGKTVFCERISTAA